MDTLEKKKMIAQESEKTRRLREKIMKTWQEEKAKITPKAIEDTVEKIHQWISDNAKDRVLIKEKRLKLFDESENSVQLSKKVQCFADKLRQDMQIFSGLREKQ